MARVWLAEPVLPLTIMSGKSRGVLVPVWSALRSVSYTSKASSPAWFAEVVNASHNCSLEITPW